MIGDGGASMPMTQREEELETKVLELRALVGELQLALENDHYPHQHNQCITSERSEADEVGDPCYEDGC